MPLYFTLNAACAELEAPAGTTIAVDPKQRTLIRGEVFAFKDADGDHFLAKIDSVRNPVWNGAQPRRNADQHLT
jgi:hypothetical protein